MPNYLTNDELAHAKGLLDRMTDFFSSLSGRRKVCSKPRFRVRRTTNPAAKKSGTDPKIRETKTSIDEILDKIRISGYASLTAEEKRHLFDQSKRL